MSFAAYQDNGVALSGYAYLCWQGGCGRWYDPASGYFDVIEGERVNAAAGATCPSHDLPMYGFQFDFVAQTVQLRCPLLYCPHESLQMISSGQIFAGRAAFAKRLGVALRREGMASPPLQNADLTAGNQA